MLKEIRNKWRRAIIYLIRLYRAFGLSLTTVKGAKTKEDRSISKLVATFLQSPSIKILYFPVGPKIFIYTEDKKYIISLSRFQIRITDQTYFFSNFIPDTLAETLFSQVLERLSADVKKLEDTVAENEEKFLNEIFASFKSQIVNQDNL